MFTSKTKGLNLAQELTMHAGCEIPGHGDRKSVRPVNPMKNEEQICDSMSLWICAFRLRIFAIYFHKKNLTLSMALLYFAAIPGRNESAYPRFVLFV
jgi:hypothetical protein